MTKPEFVLFCNQIQLLDLHAKGDKDIEETKKAKQDLMAKLVVSKAANRAQSIA